MNRFVCRSLLLMLPTLLSASGAAAFSDHVRFEANLGQTSPEVRFFARAKKQHVFATSQEIVLDSGTGGVVRLSFPGSAELRWRPTGPSVDRISYFVGDPSKWIHDAPQFERLKAASIYPGVDLVAYGSDGNLEYDLVLAPGADPSRIHLRFSGTAPRLTSSGSIEIGSLVQKAPQVWQQLASGQRRPVTGRFRQETENTFRLILGEHDAHLPVVVDPVLVPGFRIGGEGDDEIVAAGEGFVAGHTRSVAFPGGTPGLRRTRDIFVRGTEPINGNGIGFQLPTIILGGSDDDELAGAALSGNSALVLAGTTRSQDFTSPYAIPPYRGGISDGFVAVVPIRAYQASPPIVQLIGGSGEDRINALALYSSTMVLAGETDSADLQVSPQASQTALAGGKDGFYVVGSAGSFGAYIDRISYLGGSADDAARAASAGASGIWIGGETKSADFPGFVNPGLAGPSDAFLTRLSFVFAEQTAPVSYRLGGAGADSIQALQAPPAVGYPSVFFSSFPTLPAILAFAGTTSSPDLPVRNAVQESLGGGTDAFAGTWDVTAATPLWLTYLGGTGADEASTVTLGAAADVYVGGWTRSSGIATVNALQNQWAGGEDGLFAVFSPQGSLRQLTYLGGSGDDRIRSVRLVGNGTARVAGTTTSGNLAPLLPSSTGGKFDGFYADIGSDLLIAPEQLTLAKDSSAPFVALPDIAQFRLPVTYTSSVPEKLRLFSAGSRSGQVTSADTIVLEALSDNGEVELTASAPGYNARRTKVRLFPGVLVPSVPVSISTWTVQNGFYAYYFAFDPATGNTVGNVLQLREGVSIPEPRWFSSDPSVLALGSESGTTVARPQREGRITVRMEAEGFTVLNSERTVNVEAPRPRPFEINLGKDQVSGVALSFNANLGSSNTVPRGVLRIRSLDPSRVLVRVDASPARETAILDIASIRTPVVRLEALSDSGDVQIEMTSDEFDGAVYGTVHLSPSVIRWGKPRSEVGRFVWESSVTLSVGETFRPQIALTNPDGIEGSVRPGAPQPVYRIQNSNPRIVQLNRLTADEGNSGFTLTALSSGTADLTLSVSNSDFAVENRLLRVTVQEPVRSANLPATALVGRGLQVPVSFSYSGKDLPVVVSDDPSAILIAASTAGPAAAQMRLASVAQDRYSFYLRGLKDRGEVAVRVRFAGGPEQVVRVTLLRSGLGIINAGSAAAPFASELWCVAYAVDEQSPIPVDRQIPAPETRIPLRIRTEGSSIRFAPVGSTTLSEDNPTVRVVVTLPSSGEETTVVAEPADTTTGPAPARFLLRGPVILPAVNLPSTMLLSLGELRRVDVNSYAAGATRTVTSGDPSRLLLSTSATAPATSTITIRSGNTSFWVHALADSGIVPIRVEAPEAETVEIQAGLQPLQLQVYGSTVFTGSANPVFVNRDGNVSLTVRPVANSLIPGFGPVRLSVRSLNAEIATVSTASVEIPGTTTLTLHGVSPGRTSLSLEVASGTAFLQASTIPIVVLEPQPPIPPVYTLGRNLQGAVGLKVGAVSENGAIVTLTSSDPTRLLLSRSRSTQGSGTLAVTVSAGTDQTQPVYLQAFADSGSAEIRATVNGVERVLATVRLTPSWIGCSHPGNLEAGIIAELTCFVRWATVSSSPALSEVVPRPGFDANAVLYSSNPGVLSVPAAATALTAVNSANFRFSLRALAEGESTLRIEATPDFARAPDGSDEIPVRVETPRLRSTCSAEMILRFNEQGKCSVELPEDVSITATSEDPSLLTVTTDPQKPGSATAVSNGRATFYPGALSDRGTAEIVVRAPGYRDFRLAFTLIPLLLGFESTRITVRRGDVFPVGVTSPPQFTPRPGASIRLNATSSAPAVAALESDSAVLDSANPRPVFRIRGIAPGNALIQLKVPDGYMTQELPVGVTVLP